MSDCNYRPKGTMSGENVGPLPNAGTGTGMNGDSYGADLGVDAVNGKGSFDAGSDPKDRSKSKDSRV
jgi:hypothetical protein